MNDETRSPLPMTSDHPQCLVEKFSQYTTLSPDETRFLASLQSDEKNMAAKQDIISQGVDSKCFYVLKRGWAHSYKVLSNGRRQVLDFLLPGDFIGIREFAFDKALNFVVMSTDGVICPFPKSRIGEMFDSMPGLAAILMQISTRDQAILIERICNLGGRTAYQRIGHQVLELWVRLRAVGLASNGTFAFPIRQVVLADALGLSPVHVSRTLRRLKQNGLLELRHGSAAILDLPGLIEAAQFEEFYLARQTSSPWMVPGALWDRAAPRPRRSSSSSE